MSQEDEKVYIFLVGVVLGWIIASIIIYNILC